MLEPKVNLTIEEFETRCLAWAQRVGLEIAPRQRRSQVGVQVTEFTRFFYVPGMEKHKDAAVTPVALGLDDGFWFASLFERRIHATKDHSDWYGFENSLRAIETFVADINEVTEKIAILNTVFRRFSDRDVLALHQVEVPATSLKLRPIAYK